MVGGSCYLVDTGSTRLIIDFGLFYGSENQENNRETDFDPSTIDYVLLTHAHIDHSGRIPLLYKKGFKGKVVGTDATKSLLAIMLEMTMNIAKEHGMSVYDWDDYAQAMNQFMTVSYDQMVNLSPDVSVVFRDAGHVLGSAMIELWVKHGGETIKLVSTGDFGNRNTPILRDPAVITSADYILVESTYGTVRRGEMNFVEFGKAVRDTLSQGGSVLIPAFVLEKTQKLLYIIGQLKRDGVIPKETRVFLDSATAQSINVVYRRYTKYYNGEALGHLSLHGDPLSFPGISETSSAKSLQTHDSHTPSIYLSASGMLDHGNAPKHLERMIEDPKNLLAIVGWQAPGSLGGKLQEGAKMVRIPIEEYIGGRKTVRYVERPVKMKVKTFSMFSSHADGCQILEWLSHFSKTKHVYVVHGDKQNALGLSRSITENLGFSSSAPSMFQSVPLRSREKDSTIKSHARVCGGLAVADSLTTIDDQ